MRQVFLCPDPPEKTVGMEFANSFCGMSGNDAGIETLEVSMEKETNAQQARRLLAERGRACFCIQPTPEPGNQCGTIMGGNLSVSYTATRCARCKGIILSTVH